jgi:hypothetical protein
VDKQFADVAIASFADPQQPGLATRRVLFGHQTYPGGKLPAVFEDLRIAHGRHERRGGQWTKPWNGLQALADGMGVGQRLKLLLVTRYFRF